MDYHLTLNQAKHIVDWLDSLTEQVEARIVPPVYKFFIPYPMSLEMRAADYVPTDQIQALEVRCDYDFKSRDWTIKIEEHEKGKTN